MVPRAASQAHAQQDLGVRLDKVQISHPDPASCRQVLDTLHVGHLADVAEGEAALSFQSNRRA